MEMQGTQKSENNSETILEKEQRQRVHTYYSNQDRVTVASGETERSKEESPELMMKEQSLTKGAGTT